jgi:CHAT domain-containing protein
MVAAFAAGRLGAEDRHALTVHLAACGACKELVLAAGAMSTTLPVGGEWTFSRRRLALVFALVTGVLLAMRYRAPLERRLFSRSDMEAVVAASAPLEVRPSLARLSANFPYRQAKRSGDVTPAAHGSGELWRLIERLQKAGEPAALERRHALGVSYLLVGRVKPAVDTLEETIRIEANVRGEVVEAIRRSQDAALLNDLAAAYQTTAERQGDRKAVSLALEAAQRAWALNKIPQIAWTRAVVIDAYHVRERSVSAWRDYLALDSRSEWSDLARQRLSELLQPTDAERWPSVRDRLLAARNDDPEVLRSVGRFRQEIRIWCEDELLPKWGQAVLRGDASAAPQLAKIAALGQALGRTTGEGEVAEAVESIQRADASTLRRLAQGHVAYGASRLADRDSRVADSIREMDVAVAALTPELTPFAWRARAEHAGMIYMSNDYLRTRAELQKLPVEDEHLSIACKGLIDALFGIVDLQTGSYKEAADHYRRAAEAYHAAGERDYEATLLSRLAEALDEAGDSAQAHSYRQLALQILERTGDPKHLHDTMYGAARAAILQDQQAVAELFLDALVLNDTAAGVPVRTCTALMWRSAFRFRHGGPSPAATDLDDAERVCRSIGDRSLRERALANLEIAKSSLGSDESSTESLTGLDDAIAYYQRTSSHLWLRTAYFARARRLEKRGDAAAAERDFQTALDEGDASRAKIDERQLRMTFTATADEIEDGYVEFLLRQHREEEAFEVADRRRLRELVDSPTARWQAMPRAGSLLPHVRASLPFGAALIEYRVLSETIVVWVVAPDAFTTVTLPVSMGELEPAIAALESPAQESMVRANASFLYDALVRRIEPLLRDAKTLVIVPDDDLERVAYSGLYDRVQQRSLLDRCATFVAPSAELFAQSRQRWSERSRYDDRVVVVQAAAGDADAAALPEAAREAQSIAGLYRNARIIDGSRATSGSLLGELNESSVLQFVGHTVLDADPASRTLRLGQSQQARLGMADIAVAPLPRLRLVYLSACETDRGPILKSEGSITIARSFFAAGVPAVVGTLWPIEDGAARLAARTFHQHLLRGDTPAESLRQAQLMLASQGWKFRDWATLRLIGAGG